MSNIWAENDGVMSMRIGRKQPPEVHSTAAYMLRQGSQAVTRHAIRHHDSQSQSNNTFLRFHEAHWQNVTNSTIVEKIIHDHYGRKNAVKLASIGQDKNNGLLAIEALLSPYINVQKAYAQQSNVVEALHQAEDPAAYYGRELENKLVIDGDQNAILASEQTFEVITILNNLRNQDDDARIELIRSIWQNISPGGLLIVHEQQSDNGPELKPEKIQSMLSPLGAVKYYSSIAASEHKPDVVISHYSLMIEQELKNENIDKEGVYWVVQK